MVEDGDPIGGLRGGFSQEKLDRSVIAIPLLEEMAASAAAAPHAVIIDLSLVHPGGLEEARDRLHALIADIVGADHETVVDVAKGRYTQQYAYARLRTEQIRELARRGTERDPDEGTEPVLHRIWPDFPVGVLLTDSVSTIKADAASIAFSARGRGITWAVADTGIDGAHPHFAAHDTLDLGGAVAHMDFVDPDADLSAGPTDPNGHGTHVAGIIAGEFDPEHPPAGATGEVHVARSRRTEHNRSVQDREVLAGRISGVAPLTKLVSLRVLDEDGNGNVSSLLAALGYVQQANEFGRRIRIHGINLSVGYGFDPEWFACGQSPLCAEVDRLVRSGVVVVVAAGNTGYLQRGPQESNLNAGLAQTINDPGNADLAITVGSTHRCEPHVYGVSYFSSKGPTGDGRAKPDVVAPGEKIVSCAAGSGAREVAALTGDPVEYRELSGTSMAAPHVSGAVAAFLSIRQEFIGRPERVKRLVLDTATDLGRERYFQGHGLVDLMRAIQAV